MASFRTPVLRNIIWGTPPYLRCTQRRWAQVHDFRLLTTHQQPNRVLEKYKEKLDQKAREKGLKDANELREVYQDIIQELKKKATVEIPLPTPPLTAESSPVSAFPPPPSSPKPASNPGLKTLSSYLDLEKTRALPQKELEAIWRLRHVNDAQSLCAVIPLDIYKILEVTAKKHPSFILPLPKEGQGAEIHFLQWAFPAPDTVTVLFTHLAEYKLRGEYSQPHTTITHHLELAKSSKVVLLKGEVVAGRGVSVDEARWLVLCLQKFYGGLGADGVEGEERRRLLEMFTRGDEGFGVERLVDSAEKIV